MFALAKHEQRALLTANCADFVALHESDTEHYGLLLVYQDGDGRDMTWDEITAAVDFVARRFPDGTSGELVTLNHLRPRRYPR